MPDTKLEKLKSLLKLVDESLTREDFEKAFTTLTSLILKIETKNDNKFIAQLEDLKSQFDKLADDSQSDFIGLKEKVTGIIDKALEDQRISLNFIRDKARDIKDGKDGKDGINGKDGKDGSPDTSEDILRKLELLGDEILEIEDIKGLKNSLDELKNRPIRVGGGGFSKIAMDIHIIDDETPTNSGDNINFTLAHTPNPTSSLKLYRGGTRQRITEDYTLSGRNLVLNIALATGEILLCDYRI